MEDADPKLSKALLVSNALISALSLISSVRNRGPRRSAILLALGVGLPAAGELLATGPLKLLRHRARPRISGVPVAILLGWYCVINGSLVVAEHTLDRVPLSRRARRRALPVAAALVGTSLDLVLDPAGLDAGLWEWNLDGSYAAEVRGPNGRRGVPLINFVGWLALVGGAVRLYGRGFARDAGGRPGRTPALVLLAYYLAAAAWAIRKGRLRSLLYSLPFPAALLLGAGKGSDGR